jgi:putative integral membrane protein (TIGR02587 family)
MRARENPISNSLQEYGRGIAGGLFFSLPLLYTMEMWQFGFTLKPGRLLIFALATYVLLLGYNRYAGLHQDATWLEVAVDSIEEMGIGILLSAMVLTILGRLTFDMAFSEILGKVVLAGMTVAIGVSVGTAQLGGDSNDEKPEEEPQERSSTFHEQLVIAFIASVLVAANIAPTDELAVLGMYLSPLNLAALMLLSMALTAGILFYANFTGARAHIPEDLTRMHVVSRTVSFYLVALLVSALMLWFFGRFEGASLMHATSATISLGLVATFGASAGRLLLQ